MREGVCHLLELQVLQQPQFALAFSQVHPQCKQKYFVKKTFFLIIFLHLLFGISVL